MLALFFNVFLFSKQQEGRVSVKSSVIFNTLCAKCHEGECSGRLSFDTESEKTSNHIKRYVDNVNLTKRETGEFVTLLNHMKTACSILMPVEGKWEVINLSDFSLPSQKGYFIPLGLLKSGDYRIYFTAKEETHLRVEILSSDFEHFLDQRILSDGKEQILSFSVAENSNTFIRIQSRNNFHILALKLNTNL